MEIRQPRSLDEYRAGERVIAAAWREAFADIVSDEALHRVQAATAGSSLAERYRRTNVNDARCQLVALVGDEAVGTASVAWGSENTSRFVGQDEAELVTLYVDPERWGEGIGRALLSAVIDRVPPSMDRLSLQTFTANDQGRGFYESQGFETVETWRFEIAGESYPTVVYARPISDDAARE